MQQKDKDDVAISLFRNGWKLILHTIYKLIIQQQKICLFERREFVFIRLSQFFLNINFDFMINHLEICYFFTEILKSQ